MAVAVAGLAGAEGAELGPPASVPQGATLAVLAYIALGASALLHPVGWGARTSPCRDQRHVVQVTGT